MAHLIDADIRETEHNHDDVEKASGIPSDSVAGDGEPSFHEKPRTSTVCNMGRPRRLLLMTASSEPRLGMETSLLDDVAPSSAGKLRCYHLRPGLDYTTTGCPRPSLRSQNHMTR